MNQVVVIGAGPQGLAAAAHLLERGIDLLVLEAGSGPAAAVAEWAHVRLFSKWSEVMDSASKRLLSTTEWAEPGEGYPTGGEWISQYLAPLASALGDRVRYGSRVVGVSKKGRDRSVDAGREEQPFVIHVVNTDGSEARIEAKSVIDASGTWGTPSPAGSGGLPAIGENAAAVAGVLGYQIPSTDDVQALAGKHVVVVGNGASAKTAIVQLARVVEQDPATQVTWVLRRGVVGNTFGGGEADELPERGALGVLAEKAVSDGHVALVTGFRTDSVSLNGAQAVLTADDGRSLELADQVIVLTGFRPDLSILSEVRLDVDLRLQAPSRVATEVDPNIHSCGSIRATGAADLAHPDAGLYIVGAKSYGRAPTFLALTGFEQVRSVAAELAGDHEAAERVDLVLPDTGVCGGAGLFDAPEETTGGGCCAVTPVGIDLTPALSN
ncbi:putative secreted protein [Microbacterium sorbitolivorans]|uniref:Flavoprotein n=1 Tax=Microbacterium sorbitolivorans TaxID=1867410 RepID=A0A367XSW1_9MICO|nr:NAD(P)-binding domain-containing protein [Microbacterium sorbitolivorans]RCK56723.1 flavoprotein [Microbacterium sorbitolivorans]GGF50727.1 putative secreted protein [Microbacterium sorbitolivorans]